MSFTYEDVATIVIYGGLAVVVAYVYALSSTKSKEHPIEYSDLNCFVIQFADGQTEEVWGTDVWDAITQSRYSLKELSRMNTSIVSYPDYYQSKLRRL